MSSSTDIQRDLEDTRARMSAELDALAYKLDVPGRAKERIGAASRRVRGATPDSDDVRRGAHDNPLSVVLGGVAVGVLAGLLLPRTKVEDERVGPIADQVRDELVASGREAAQRGKAVARRAGEAAKETARQAAEAQGEAMRDSVSRRTTKVAQR